MVPSTLNLVHYIRFTLKRLLSSTTDYSRDYFGTGLIGSYQDIPKRHELNGINIVDVFLLERPVQEEL